MLAQKHRVRKYDITKNGMELDKPPPPALISGFFSVKKNKFDKENYYEAFYRENVPEEPPPKLHNKPPLIISKSGVAM